MKNKRLIKIRRALVLGLVLTLTLGCERDLTDDAVPATFPRVGEIFTDNFVSMGSDFYLPFAGSKLDAFSVDNDEGYESSASYRIDVPNANDPTGNYAGAILRVDGAGRDLSGFDALTFWAKASQGVSLDAVGFGQDFIDNQYLVTANNFSIGTNWAKYTIPIPDASKLNEERGVFWYSTGTQATNGLGYIVWFDDIKFEKLGTVAQPRPAISNGNDLVVDTFTSVSIPLTGLTQTFNLASGIDRTVAAAPSYFDFTSSDPSVASVDESGVVTVNSAGTSIITATLGGMDAEGSLTINSLGDFDLAPTPTRDPSNVTSIYSDYYDSVPVDFFNGFWEPFQTTLSADFNVNGDNILNYTNFNFVGNQFANPTVDATEKNNLHIDMYIPGSVPANFDFLISVVNFGPDQVDGGGDDTRQQIFVNSSQVVANTWMSFDFPLTLANRDNIGLIIYENINGSSLSNFYLDNIYFFGIPVSPTDAPEAPTEDEVANNVISVFSDSYTDVANDGLNNFDSGSVLAVQNIASNDVLKYSNLNFTGLEFLGPNIIDASATTTLHLDLWSPDANEFKIKLVDFGADGAFGGGDDTEHEINLGATATNQWVAYDIELSDFIGLASTQNLAQIIFVNAPTGTLFIDNLYFYN
ncbi:Ig-like domain-containing protein [Winogradskyella schleiferi]|uniref:Ig-like domain-containing protein n=1 Tax=Winogradskyella schleiferi TaxID=2686078 RepID=UPI0015B808B5|nr:Ig-like domain-containing protein [Winogradskyella schleiferi]